MAKIEYETQHVVRLDGRVVGLIKRDAGGWYYKPNGGGRDNRGPSWRDLDRCKRDIEKG